MLSSFNSLGGLWAALAWGASDYSGGMAARRTHVLWVVLISQVVGIFLLGILAFFFRENIPLPRILLLGAGAGLIGEFGLLSLYQGLARGRMGIVAPLSAVISALLPAFFGILNEGLPTTIQLGGILVAFPAIWLISASAKTGRVNKLEISLPLLAGICFGFFLS